MSISFSHLRRRKTKTSCAKLYLKFKKKSLAEFVPLVKTEKQKDQELARIPSSKNYSSLLMKPVV